MATGDREPRPLVRMCVRCEVTTKAPVVVGVVHENSGPGFVVYACRTCATHYPPEPDVLSVPPPAERERRSSRVARPRESAGRPGNEDVQAGAAARRTCAAC